MRWKKQHQHKMIRAKRELLCFSFCVDADRCAAHPERQAAHGGVMYVDHCSCGAIRRTEANGVRTNHGPWLTD